MGQVLSSSHVLDLRVERGMAQAKASIFEVRALVAAWLRAAVMDGVVVVESGRFLRMVCCFARARASLYFSAKSKCSVTANAMFSRCRTSPFTSSVSIMYRPCMSDQFCGMRLQRGAEEVLEVTAVVV